MPIHFRAPPAEPLNFFHFVLSLLLSFPEEKGQKLTSVIFKAHFRNGNGDAFKAQILYVNSLMRTWSCTL